MLRPLARFAVRHHRLVIAAWLALVAGALLLSQGAGGRFSNDLSVPGNDSDRAPTALREKFPDQAGDAMQVVVHTPIGVRDESVRRAVDNSLAAIRSGPDVVGVVSPYATGGVISGDGTTAIAYVQFAERAKDIPTSSLDAAQEAAAPIRQAGAQVEFGGAAVQSEAHPNDGELVGLLAAVIVLLFVFGSVFATAGRSATFRPSRDIRSASVGHADEIRRRHANCL